MNRSKGTDGAKASDGTALKILTPRATGRERATIDHAHLRVFQQIRARES